MGAPSIPLQSSAEALKCRPSHDLMKNSSCSAYESQKKPTWLVASPFCISWMPTLLLVSSIYLCLSCPVCMTTTPFCYWKQYRYMLVIHVIPLSVCGGYGSCIAIPMNKILFLVALVVVPPCFFSWRYFTLSYPTQLLGRTPFVIWVCLKIRSPDFDGVSWVSL